MKITVMTGFSTKGDMDINACHYSWIKFNKGTISLFFFLLVKIITAQPLQLTILPTDIDTSYFKKNYEYQKQQLNQETVNQEIQKIIKDLKEEGYLEANVISYSSDSPNISCEISLGKIATINSIELIGVEEQAYNSLRVLKSKSRGKPFSLDRINYLKERIIQWQEKNGYPFARVQLDTLSQINNKYDITFVLERDQLIFIDTIIQVGEVKISNTYLANYLNLHKGDIYNESQIRTIEQKLKQLSFLRMSKKPQIIFIEDQAKIICFIENKPASRFDFILGILPDNTFNENNVLITGDLDLSLINPFGKGRKLAVTWNNLQPRTQHLNILFNNPYILSSSIGAEVQFQLQKLDTFFLNTHFKVAAQYLFNGQNYIELYVQRNVSSLISIDKPNLISSKELPPQLDYTQSSYGGTWQLQNINNPLVPTKGWKFRITGGVGVKKTLINSSIAQLTDPTQPEFNFGSLYLDIKDQVQYQFESKADKYFSVTHSSVIKLSYQYAQLVSDLLFDNELYRIGGYQTIRGFDESSIIASQYLIPSIEYQYLIGENSYVSLFTNWAYAEKKILKTKEQNQYLGIGTGLFLQTQAGLVGFNIAFGGADNQINFRSGKVHLSYVNEF